MLKLEFTNAQVKDHGHGLEVNGKSLEDIISVALGTKAGKESAGYGNESSLKAFHSNCCDITIIIDPKPTGVHIETDEAEWYSVSDLEKEAEEQYERSKKADAEAES